MTNTLHKLTIIFALSLATALTGSAFEAAAVPSEAHAQHLRT